jgi:hypothetical protein
LAIVDGGVAADDFARVDVAWDTALGGGDNAIADGAMAGDPDLTSQNDGLTDRGGTGEADLGAEQGILAHG